MPVKYEGAGYHKRYRSIWGPAKYQTDKTECPPELGEAQVVKVLEDEIQRSIDSGRCSVERDGEWPRYVWGRTTFVADTERTGGLHSMGAEFDLCWEARVSNAGMPVYKAYPVSSDRHSQMMPPAVRRFLRPDV